MKAWHLLLSAGATLLWALAPAAWGLKLPAPDAPFVLDSYEHPFVVKMFPEKRHLAKGKWIVDAPPVAVAYRSNGRKALTEIWRSTGWEGEWFLARDGQNIVTLGSWRGARDRAGLSDLAISFRHRGKLVKAYTVKDLLKKPARIEDESDEFYDWRAHLQLAPNGFTADDRFHLVLIDGSTYDFDYRTGEIVKTKLNEPAKSAREARDEQRIADFVLGGDLYEKSAFRKQFEPHFAVRSTEIVGERDADFFLQPKEWIALLDAKKAYGHPCHVKARLPVGEAGIATTVTPAQIDRAFERGVAHPFFLGLCAEWKDAGLRLSMSEDSLREEDYPLQVDLLKLKGEIAEDRALAQWAQLKVESSSGSTELYLNTETGEVVTEIDFKLVLLNAKGSVIARPPPAPTPPRRR